jgi:uroporphyrinogen decarboxylase
MKTYSFTGGRPSPEDFPIQGLIDATARVLTRRGRDMIAYPHQVDQHDELRQVAATRFEQREGVAMPEENIVITSGSTQCIYLAAQILAQPGDTVITEELSYMGSLGRFRQLELSIAGVPVDPIEGMNVVALEHTLQDLAAQGITPKFLYTIATYHNPTGAILTLERRQRILELAREYGIPILEDDCYGDVSLDAAPVPPSFYALGPSQPIVFIGSFSKILGPGVRLGYACAPPTLKEQINALHLRSGGTSALASLILAEYFRDNLWSHIAGHNEVIGEKRDVLLQAIETELGDTVSWNCWPCRTASNIRQAARSTFGARTSSTCGYPTRTCRTTRSARASPCWQSVSARPMNKTVSGGHVKPHERFLACMHFQAVDRPPLWEWPPWPSALRRWQREELGEGNWPPQYAECENKVQCGVDLWMLPRYKEEILAEDEQYVTKRTDRGVVQRTPKSPDTMTMPEHISYPVKTRADWETLKRRFDPNDPARFPTGWTEQCARWRDESPVLVLQGPRSPSLFGLVRELFGPERTFYAFYDDPDLVHDVMEFNTAFILSLLPRILDEAPLTSIFFWEDMCYRGGPLISPAMFREFMLPRYQRITDLARSKGIDTIFVDSDGDVSQLIPLWLQAGINGIYPMEVAAGMDVVKLRREYGKDLLMTGGIDKRVLARDRRAIDAEIEAKVPLAESGGYIPHIDHAIPHDVPYENFCYYWTRKKALLGIPD